ncbi:MAG: ATP-binding cassette domain-containing protein [Frankiaceae bacterium]|nr:ATP-binding cassette domain-containing protein [Frankiaceae bacterium]
MLEFDGLRKSYDAVTALDGISFQVGEGEVVGFVGANGAGKSTAMRIAMGVLAPDAGAVRWAGRPIDAQTRRGFGYMPEQRGLYPKMRIQDQIAYLGRLHGMARGPAAAAAGRLLGQLAVAAEPRAQLQSLSLGNQQRVQLAAALVHDPRLLILDEPFSGLDPMGVDTMAGVLAQRAAAGVAVLFSSHQLELVERLCDRIAIITAGRLIAFGTLEQLRAAAGPRLLELDLVPAPTAGTVPASPTSPAGAMPASPAGPAPAGDVPSAAWLPAGIGARIHSADPAPDGPPGALRYLLRLADPDDDQAVLAAAAGAGRVLRFGWQQLPLAQLYRGAVAAGPAPAA